MGADLEFLDEHRQGFQNYVGTPGPVSVKGVPGPRRRDEQNRAQSWDPYLQADWEFAPGWRALLGARQANVRVTSDDRFVAGGNGDDSGVAEFDAVLPVAGLRVSHEIRDAGTWSLHAAASRGAETPTLNELAYRPDGSAGLNHELRAARSAHVELGGRWQAACWRTDLALFHVDTRDEIVVAGSSGGRTTFRNASGTRRDGLEASVQWEPLPALAALVAYGFVDARYDADFAGGNRLPGVPRHQVFGELAWRGGGRVQGAVEGVYRGAVHVNDAATDAAPSHAVFNVRMEARVAPGLALLARVDNLLDESYAGSVIVNEANGRFFEPAPGVGVAVGLRWIPPA